jgi:peptide/nickel transport system permease protein
MASGPATAPPAAASPRPARPESRSGRAGRARRARQHPSAVLGAAIVLALVAAALLAPLIAPRDPLLMNQAIRLQPPSADHALGTDNYGRDLFTRLVYGTRVSLVVGLASVALAVAIGTTLGLASGYLAGWADLLLMRIVDVVLAFPSLLLALSLVSVLGTGVGSVIVAVGLVQWTTYARVVRATALALKQEEFILAARALGLPGPRIAIRHILPNALAPLLVLATLGIGGAITTEAALSFLGLGVPPPTPSWGATLAFGLAFLRDSPHLATFPGLAIMLTVLGFNLLGDGLRDLTDPRMRRG